MNILIDNIGYLVIIMNILKLLVNNIGILLCGILQ
jgi:hypothetical protein